MKGIITKVLEVKALYDNMSEALKSVYFEESDGFGSRIGSWWTRDIDGKNFHVGVDVRSDDWFILYGEDEKNSCELEFVKNEAGEMVPYEYTVWTGHYGHKTYHKVF